MRTPCSNSDYLGSGFLDLGWLPCHLAPVGHGVGISYALRPGRRDIEASTNLDGILQGGVEQDWVPKALRDKKDRSQGVFISNRTRKGAFVVD